MLLDRIVSPSIFNRKHKENKIKFSSKASQENLLDKTFQHLTFLHLLLYDFVVVCMGDKSHFVY